MTLEYVLRKNGIDPKKDVTLDDSIKFDLMAGAFTSGNADYVTLFEPTASLTSKENKGTTVTIVINQEINYDSTGLILKDINNYSSPKRKLRVLLVDNNDELERVEKILDEKDIDKVVTLFGQDCVDKIEHNEEYDLIIIKDELNEETAYEILNKLKQIPKFKTPVIIAIDKEKEFIKDHFIKDGFKDCIILNDDKKALEEIINKYI